MHGGAHHRDEKGSAGILPAYTGQGGRDARATIPFFAKIALSRFALFGVILAVRLNLDRVRKIG